MHANAAHTHYVDPCVSSTYLTHDVRKRHATITDQFHQTPFNQYVTVIWRLLVT